MQWSGPFILRCSCGWESEPCSNPIVAQWKGEAHTISGFCIFYNLAKERLMSRQEFFDQVDVTDWLKPQDVKDGQVVVIESFERIANSLGVRPCLRFKGIEKPFTLNKTNYDFFMNEFGENEMEWEGESVTIKIEQAKNPQNKDRLQPAIRFRRVKAESKKK